MEVMNLSPRGIREHLSSTGRSMRAPRPTAISAASPTPTAASPGRRPTSPTSCKAPRLIGVRRGRARDRRDAPRAVRARQGQDARAHHAELIARSAAAAGSRRSRPLRAGRALFDSRRASSGSEIGFGGGEHLVAQAAARIPTSASSAASRSSTASPSAGGDRGAAALTNMRLRAGDATALIEAAPEASLRRASYLLYPDPWPKRRQQQAPASIQRRDDRGARARRAARRANCASPPTSTTTPAGRCGAFSPRRISMGGARRRRLARPWEGWAARATKRRRAPRGERPPI